MKPLNNNNNNNNPNENLPNLETTEPSDAQQEDIYNQATALIFVIDAQDEPYDHVLQSFTETVTRAITINPNITIEVFINKVDGELFFSEEAKYDCRRDIMQQAMEELQDAGFTEEIPIAYHLTSIYDHSIFEAFSRVVQKLIPQLQTPLENLLNVLVSTCSMEKAYLFDVASKLYISTDSSPVDTVSVELCSDMIDVVLDVSGIYGLRQLVGQQQKQKKKHLQGETLLLKKSDEGADKISLDDADGAAVARVGERNEQNTDVDMITNTDTNYAEEELSGEQHGQNFKPTTNVGDESYNGVKKEDKIESEGDDDEDFDGGGNEAEMFTDSAYDSESSSVIRLSNGMVLYLKEVDTMLALVCITRSENFRKKSLINYNISCLKKALKMLVQSPASLPIASSQVDEAPSY